MTRRVLITGATSGIGRGLLEHYDAQGREVVAFNRRQDALLEARHPKVRFLHTDVLDRAGVQAYFKTAAAEDKLPGLYYLNAGINKVDNLDGFSLDVFQKVMDTNLTGVLNFLDAALPALAGRRAVFVTSSSTSNIFPNPNNLGYYVSKLAAAELFKMLDARYAPRGLEFKTLILGPVATNIFPGGELASKLQTLVRDLITVTVEQAVPAIARFVESPGKVFYYPTKSVAVFRLAALAAKVMPGFYTGSAPAKG